MEWGATWTRLDNTDNLVASYVIDRARQYETDRTDPGTATVRINDQDGILDPTNSGGPYYGKIDTDLQAAIARWNPVLDTWHTRFRGFIDDMDYRFDPSQRINFLEITLVDLFDTLSAIEMLPGEFGDPQPPGSESFIYFDEATMDARIVQVLGNALDATNADYWVVFTGNVDLVPTRYTPGESPMTVIQEAADAEFPGVANVYTDRYGRLVAHGRLAKFDPAAIEASAAYTAWSGATAYVATNRVMSGGLAYECILAHTNHVPPNATYWVQIPKKWDWNHWHAGDGAAVVVTPSTVAQLRRFAFNRGRSKVINSATAYPMSTDEHPVTDAAIEGQLVKDMTSIGIRGIRSWSAPDLLTLSGLLDSSTRLVETKRFAEYYVANYAAPRNRVTDIAFRSMDPVRTAAAINWRLLSEIDISDQISITIDSPGGGGFTAEEFFVEGIHEDVRPLNAEYDDVTVSLDLSPIPIDTSMFPVS